jgi:anti-sigma factor RsiW
MTDTPTQDDLLAYFHGLLPGDTAAAMAARVAANPDAQATLAVWAGQNANLAALYQPMAAEPVPERLTGVIRKAAAMDARPTKPRLWLAAACVALLAVGGTVGWMAHGFSPVGQPGLTLAMAAMQAHDTYVVEVKHPVEVLASDQAHMNTWMSKRLGHDISPPDLSDTGFALLGGRVLPAGKGVAALYMYENAQGQRVTLYITPQGAGPSTAFQYASEGVTQSFYWMDNGLSCALVGDIAKDALRGMAVSAYDQLI